MKNNLMLSLNNAKDYLKSRNENGQSVYNHICDIINFIIVEKPEKSYEHFEMISSHIKESKKGGCVSDPSAASYASSSHRAKGKTSKDLNTKDVNLDNYILQDYIKNKKDWLAKIKFSLQKRLQPKPSHLPFLKNFNEQAKLINWAGYHIGSDSVWLINESMKDVLEKYKNELTSLHFWGILKGVKKDYYILEGLLKGDSNFLFQKKGEKSAPSEDSKGEKSSGSEGSASTDGGDEEDEDDDEDDDDDGDDDEEEEEENDNDEEQDSRHKKHRKAKNSKGKNKSTDNHHLNYRKEDFVTFNKRVNRHVYWASVNGTDEWVLLKPTTPQYIQMAKKTNKMLTGDMNKIITAFPNIAIKEKHYLRALISLISSHTHISPRKYYITRGAEKKQLARKGKKGAKNQNSDEDEDEQDYSDASNGKNDDSSETKDENEYTENGEEEEEEEMRKNEDEGDKRNGDLDHENDNHLAGDDILIENKKFQYDANALSRLDNWVHCKHSFLPNGHVCYPKDGLRKKGGQESNTQMKQMIKNNPPLKILRGINAQEENQVAPTWKVKHLNPGHSYGAHSLHYDVIVLYNFIFYGAFTVYSNKQFFNFYIGNGIKSKHSFIHTYQPGKIESDESELSEVDHSS
ncbi:radial spoke head protein, putative [Plasmodium knowlesi strain H]|uniref:Radial spoke head protein, putative n=3 Tax=Plasmodium knowlesi TaxID=5850 RepID=A0A5K1V4K4_PLAKH|nr:radial spoke head protein, putative [Plasmodium knowlesi strain H]OTN64887.1 putative Radial spoke head protein [Plasmodium knowlesi]CAA9988072.1 radial spoke head protein, putative [Plasmodium knowlesi strain H]SBO19930.1 radial spoke head protein, putative [Plasmodium knowlesi strain H]SBO29076.1 radial spoke head protein, putative [Plasmodium knowlesi strain H]VVS77546.1 radial spoke head protein, putative [Plasmodium knowlesi strain H]|eukprot:XP_002259046.1 hypothetical protein, conserved in Plasmodium species [Plasmodium knowlesi strain H]